MALKFALAGNPNCGKTTLFNELTGSSAHVGNWPGVTIERREGHYRRQGQDIDIIDLPGIYSLSPYTPEEIVARNYLIEEAPNAIINIIDATNLERNLYLTTQILETDYPVIIALNMTDLLEKNGDVIDVKGLSEVLGVPVVPISALRHTGIPELMDAAIANAQQRSAKTFIDDTAVLRAIEAAQAVIEKTNLSNTLFHAIKLIENDPLLLARSEIIPYAAEIEAIKARLDQEKNLDAFNDIDSLMSTLRYEFITKKAAVTLKRNKRSTGLSHSDKIDKLLTNRYLGIPVFLGLMLLVFHLTFGENLFGINWIPGPGAYLFGLMESFIGLISNGLTSLLTVIGASDWVFALVIDGIIGGVGAVASFIPQIGVMFIFLSIMEDSGYMARAAFIMDRALRRFGLSGKSFLPLLMGFGCGVPGILATRTLESEKDRRLTAMLVPFMSCGAKAPIYALFAGVLFADHAGLMTFAVYMVGIVTAIVAAIILKKTVFKGEASPFIMELPTYHAPQFRALVIHVWEKLRGYVVRAGTILLLASIIIWFLASFGWANGHFGMVEANSATSIVGIIGNALRFIFIPLGFGAGDAGWKVVIAIITGLVAKEMVVSTMGILYNPGVIGDALEQETAGAALATTVAGVFSPAAALAFMTFNLLSVPCMAAVAAVRAEMHSAKWTWFTIGFWLATAWIVSFIIYQVGTLLGY